MTKPSGRTLAAAGLLLVLGAALGAGDQSRPRSVKRVGQAAPRPARALRVEGLAAGRRGRAAIAPDRVLVRFRAGVDETYAEGLLRSYGFPAVRRIPGIGVYSVKTSPGVTVAETLALLRRNGDVERAGPDHRARLADVPNDTYFADYQYALRNTGGILQITPFLQYQTTAGADIKATTAWDAVKGGPETVIAILDTGVDMTHPDLAAKIISPGHDFANDDDDATDDHWHGTHVAGIAAADTNNSTGIAGVAWNCRILPVKVVDASGSGWYSWIIDGIIWAVDHGADVINLSLGDIIDDEFLRDACRYAHDNGVVVVASAGNDGTEGVFYPAAYDAYVLAVAASDFNDAVAAFSSFGPEIDVAAPGVWIIGPAPQAYVGTGALPYLFASGTSMAAPHVAGLAALIKSAKPDLSVDDIMKVIRYTADDINRATAPGRDDHVGYGRINMARALAPTIIH
jgi:thermitase